MNILVLIRGLPGTGKSTLAKQFASCPNWLHVEADMWMVDENGIYSFNPTRLKEAHAQCRKMAELGLDQGKNVVVSNTFTQRWEFEPYTLMTPNHVIIELTKEYGSIHGVPEESMQRMRNRWESII